jgi:hypothetical protein
MFFVITQDNFVIVGPNTWNRFKFEEALQEECGITYTLPNSNDSGASFIISEVVKILPVVSLPEPEYNSKIQRLDGPYWIFSDQNAQMYYTAVDLPVDAVRNSLIALVANNRYYKEVGGIKMTVQETVVSIDTARNSRNIYIDAYNTVKIGETVNWKFPECWMSINRVELDSIVQAIKGHVEYCFNWEMAKDQEINSAQTLQELNAIVTDFT